MDDKLRTTIVNDTQHVLIMKVGNQNHFAPPVVVDKLGRKHAIEISRDWTYQEYSLKKEKKVFVTSDDCCGDGDEIIRDILRGDSKLASGALKLARHVRTKGLHRGSAELQELVLELVEFAQSACESPLICPVWMRTLSDHQLQDPRKYAASLLLLARDVDAHPWGAFGFVHPAQYLPFLQQLAGDLMDH